MSIGLLIITHNEIGRALLKTTTNMMEVCPLATATLEVGTESDPDAMWQRAQQLIQQLNQGDGVLILTDMYGSTPSNIAYKLRREDQVQVIAGINLPMLVRVFNYATMNLKELTRKAVSGGIDGIVCCPERKPETPNQ
ncbi:PTS sugar transporter subunit IIA [endosymbiont of Ridgeia piscesae]|jgi:PTS system ascorbate-specific IIA component|uniref:PTS system, ascorbate-specific IIA component n=1 Tax=endosymbiont of Ridgeia piscesae TaxID=54398 RepID=A0A0T5YT65_9GAMM|nr:PTS fructose transporter subunit IIA [endosymbiont of Ridgeia piscesae]KRT53724.1 Phosphotransferase system, mannose/fructose-specific component IIA [endosymbiont of Ridgeia piscesae]KRT58103.1 PTS system, ascorbate-specific IIA component [endosymbiont of Ridgeia piscesae]